MTVDHANGGPRTPRYNHKPFEMYRRDTACRIEDVGEFAWRFDGDNRVLVIAIPNVGCRGWIHSEWTIDHRNASDALWQWDGNEEKPTLTPSLHAVGIWHGYVKQGNLVEA